MANEIKSITVEMTRTESRTADLAGTEDQIYIYLATLRATDWKIESINDKAVVGFCETCGKPILDDEESTHDSDDGCDFCAKCSKEMANDFKSVASKAIADSQGDFDAVKTTLIAAGYYPDDEYLRRSIIAESFFPG